ncbi:hypothetical protein EHLJMEHL_03540 [Vreelandella titanicae]
MSKLKKMPSFKNEAEEREFWETHDSSDYLDWSQAKSASFSKLRCKRQQQRRDVRSVPFPALLRL